MNKLKSLGKTVLDNKDVLIKRSIQGAALAAGYFAGTAVLSKLTRGETVIVEGDAIVEITPVD